MYLEVHVRSIPQREGLRHVLDGLLAASDLAGCPVTWHVQPTPQYDAKWWSSTVAAIAGAGLAHDWLLFFEDDVDQLNPHIRHNIENWGARDEPTFGLGWMIVPNGVLADKARVGAGETGALYRRAPALHNSAVVLVRRDMLRLMVADVQAHPDVYATCDHAQVWGSHGVYAGDVLACTDVGWTWCAYRLGRRVFIHTPGLATTDEIGGYSFVQQRVAAEWGRRSHECYDGAWRAPARFVPALVAALSAGAGAAEPLAVALQLLGSAPPGNILEFGVYTGGTINLIAAHVTNAGRADRIYGFDVFSGLPEAWRPGFEQGMFSTGGVLPAVPSNVTLMVGLFEHTLPAWCRDVDGRVALVHVDCDLYSSTACAMMHLRDRVDDETLWVFDELFHYSEFEQGEMRALREFCEATGRKPVLIASGGRWGQAAAMYLREELA